MKLGLFTDPHYSSLKVTCVTRRPSLSLGKMREALAAMADCDLILCLGDLIDDCGDPVKNREILTQEKNLLDAIRCRNGNLAVSCGKPVLLKERL